MIDLEEAPDGMLLPVKARAGASQNAITGTHDGRLKVSVTQAPEKGKANQAIVKLLARSLGLSRSQIELVSGETSPQKTFLVSGMTRADLRQLTEQWL